MKAGKLQSWNNGAVVYIGSFLTVHIPLFFVHKLWLNKLMRCEFKMIGMLLNVVHGQVQES